MFAQIAQAVDASKMVPSADQIAGWSASQTIQWLLVVVLICVAIAAYFGMKALSRSNEAVNANYDKSIVLWKDQFDILNKRYDAQEHRHATRDNDTNSVLKQIAVSLQVLADRIPTPGSK